MEKNEDHQCGVCHKVSDDKVGSLREREFDIGVLECNSKKNLYLSQALRCLYIYMPTSSRWGGGGVFNGVVNVVSVTPLWGLNEMILFLPTARILIAGV